LTEENKPTKPGTQPLQVIEGQREALEREYFRLILDGNDEARMEVLLRRLRPSANDTLSVAGEGDWDREERGDDQL
jgi:hypothetical protein